MESNILLKKAPCTRALARNGLPYLIRDEMAVLNIYEEIAKTDITVASVCAHVLYMCEPRVHENRMDLR